MIGKVIQTGFRMVVKQKIYTFINLTGLAVGLATCLFIMLYILDEFRYDSFHKDAKQIFRVNLFGRMSDQEFKSCFTSAPMAAGIKSEFPEIDETCRIAIWDDIPVQLGDISFTESKILVADSNYFNFFSFELLQGDPKKVLNEPNAIVLTESMASRLLGYKGKGDNSPIGKFVNIGMDKRLFKVTGITEDPPHHSHFHYTLILPMESWDNSHSQAWLSSNLSTYLKLKKNTTWLSVQDKFPGLVKKYVGPQVQAAMGISMDDFFSQGGAYGYTLQPMLKIHLHPEVDRELEPAGNMSNIYIMITIMIFVLIIACINFMNLSTARFSTRAREVGVRKTLGASKSLLIVQFLGESFLLTFFSFLIAMVILAILLSHFNLLAGKELAFDMLLRTDLIPGLILMLIIVAIISGSYPAFYLSSFRPVEVLKGKIRTGKGSGLIRRSLVVFQFFISIVLIISTLIIFKQLKYLDKKDPGFNKDNVMVIRNADALGSNKISFKEELKNMTGVSCASIVTRTPPDVDYTDIFIPVHEDAKDIGFNYCFADEDLQKTLGLTMASGRYFSHEFPSDSGGIIINEAALKMIGREDFTGEKIRTHWEHMKEPRQVIGVVKDFNFQTLEKGITPLAIFPGSQGNQILVRFSQGDNSGIIKRVESKWRAFTDGFPFEYSFIEEDFSAKFRKEQKLAGIFMLFTILAIFIACMGLFGLSTFMAEQRRKEMGIRKVLGATLTLILRTMSREFFVLVLVAFLLASPVTYLILSLWLNGFAYRTSIDLLTILVGGVAAFLVTIISVAYQSINVASKNPVESLKYE